MARQTIGKRKKQTKGRNRQIAGMRNKLIKKTQEQHGTYTPGRILYSEGGDTRTIFRCRFYTQNKADAFTKSK